MTTQIHPSRFKEDNSLGVIVFILIAGFIWSLFATRPNDVPTMVYPTLEMHGYMMLGAFLLGILAVVYKLSQGEQKIDQSEYQDDVIKAGVIATTFWGLVGMLVSVVIACQLTWPNVFYFCCCVSTVMSRMIPTKARLSARGNSPTDKYMGKTVPFLWRPLTSRPIPMIFASPVIS